MKQSVKMCVVIGLLVHCIFNINPVEAKFKLFSKQPSTDTLIHRHHDLLFPSTSHHRTYSQHLYPSSSLSSLGFMPLLESPSSPNIFRPASLPSLNGENWHRQAALALNSGSSGSSSILQPQSNIMRRRIPNLAGKFVRNGAIGFAAVGAGIVISNEISKHMNRTDVAQTTNISTVATTVSPKPFNPLEESEKKNVSTTSATTVKPIAYNPLI